MVVPLALYSRKLVKRVKELETQSTLQADLIVDLAKGMYKLNQMNDGHIAAIGDLAGMVGNHLLGKTIAEHGKGD